MDLIEKLLPGEGRLTYQGVDVEVEPPEIVVRMKSAQRVACCPVCGQPSRRQHSRYERTVQDLPWATFRVIIRLEVGKWFCQNPNCVRRIFTERLPQMVRPWGRRTNRLVAAQTAIGLTTGGRAGAGLSRALQVLTSRVTLIRLVRRQPLKEVPTPRVLGIDDWAKRKGQTYGTLLVDLEPHQAVDVLPERSAECVEQWLRGHPGVEIISRDRGGEYATGAVAGAPQALQVADRFHLLKNVGDALTEALKPYSRELRAISVPPTPPSQGASDLSKARYPVAKEPTSTALSPRTVRQQAISQQKQAKRRAVYERVRHLQQQGWMQKTIAREVQLSAKTVSRWLAVGDYPERRTQAAPAHRIDPYCPHLLERWASGCRNAAQLCREIQALGYPGGVTMVRDFMALLRRAAGLPAGSHALAPGFDPLAPVLTPRALTTILFKPVSKRTEEQSHLLVQVREQMPALQPLLQLVEAFILMVRQRLHTALQAWLDTAATFPAFGPLVKGLRRDYAAVYAALSTEWSNGQTEGQVNRLKFLKRQGYGRANFDLLRRRVLLLGP